MKAALLLFCVASVLGHVRWTCPTPRNMNPGLKVGPCGPVDDGFPDIFNGTRTTIAPGLLTVAWEETIIHQGAPFRVALSFEGVDRYEECVLLDHIPHRDTPNDPECTREIPCLRSQFFQLTVRIPDVQCEACSLQIIEVMTDKTPLNQQCHYDPLCTEPFAQGCPNEPGLCFSNYHSCANVRITGAIPREQFVCQPPADWPLVGMPFQSYTQEAGQWDEDGLHLPGLPPYYNEGFGECAKRH